MSKWGKKKDEKPAAEKAATTAETGTLSDLGRTGEFRVPEEDDSTVVEKLDAQLAAELERKNEGLHPDSLGARADAAEHGVTDTVEPPAPAEPSTEAASVDAVRREVSQVPVQTPRRRRCKSCGNLVPDDATVCSVDGTEQPIQGV